MERADVIGDSCGAVGQRNTSLVMKAYVISETFVNNKRLGRHVQHDERSREFVAKQAEGPLKRVSHRRWSSVFDQGNLGSCTGNAAAGLLNTVPIHIRGKTLHEPDAVELYSLATELDEFNGQYPPEDTGSSGLAVAKAALQLNLITSYGHAFGVDAALQVLQIDPVITGVNWYEGFDVPDKNGLVKIEGQIRGGHEFEVHEYIPNHDDPLNAMVGCINSWGKDWGIDGKFYMTVRDWGVLLTQDGDVTVFYK